jgi:hypothetical protein
MIRQTFTFTGAGEDFGPRSFGLVTAHTTESPYNKLSVSDAVVLARWQDRPDILGSYNDLICIDGILSTVPASHASGGINPASLDWHPEAWLYEVMSPEMVRNPNYFTRNVSFMGSKLWFDNNGWPPAMIDNFVTVMLEEEARMGRPAVLTDHEDFQTNRSDAGPIAHSLISQRYLQRTEDPMIVRSPIVTQEWMVIPGKGSTFTREDGTTGQFTVAERVKSVAEVTLPGGVNGRVLDYGPNHEALVIRRAALEAIPGTRIIGSPVGQVIEVPTGITQAQLSAAVAAATAAAQKVCDAKVAGIKSKVAALAVDVAND